MGLKQRYQEKIRRLTRFDLKKLPSDPRIDDLMAEYLKKLRSSLPKNKRETGYVPGAAVMVRHCDNLIHLRGYGHANLETGAEITPKTVFDLGSVSKQFTAFAVLSTFNRPELDTPISYFFRGLPSFGEEITILDLIQHTSALPEYIKLYVAAGFANENFYDGAMSRADDWYPQMARRKKKKILSNKGVLKLVASQKLLPREPDLEFQYSNTGYVLLAELLRRATQQSLADILEQKVFKVVGMKDTYVLDEKISFRKSAPQIANHARCYNVPRRGKGYVPVGYTPVNYVYGDGNIQSTIVDMAKWDAHLTLLDYMNVCTDQPECEKHTLDARTLIWEPAELRGRRRVDYGAGWNLIRNRYKAVEKINGQTITRTIKSRAEDHRGEWLGWRSYIARAQRWVAEDESGRVNPNTWQSMGVVVLMNNTVPATHAQFYGCTLAQEIARLAWGDFKRDNIMRRVDCSL